MSGASKADGANQDVQGRSMLSDVRMLVRAAMVSPERNQLAMILAGVVVVVGGVAFMQIKLNAWNQPFYDALSARNFTSFMRELGTFAIIAGILLCLTVAQTWLQEMLKLVLRKQATRDLLDQWLAPGRAFRISRAGDIGVNPDQRLAEDTRHLTELSAQLAIGLFQATLLLISFVGVLWVLSKSVVFTYDERTFSIPGYMVWCAFFYAGTASWLSWVFGRRLIAYNAQRYAREADLRVAMVRVAQHVDAVTLYGSEQGERRRLDLPLNNVLDAMRLLVSALARLTWVTSGYGWFALVAPIIVAAPAYFSGNLTFGALMMAVGAFNQVQQALRWFVDNFAVIADWQATLFRVVSFRQALMQIDNAPPPVTANIRREKSPDDALELLGLEVGCNSHVARLNEAEVTLRPGEHVLVTGEQGVGKTAFFRSIAGLWDRGSGSIMLPPRSEMLFLPSAPYLPPGTLRDTMLFLSKEHADDAALKAALIRLGLDNLTGDLDRFAQWDRELPMDEQQRLAFARALIQKPRFIIIDEAIEQINLRNRQLIRTVLDAELQEAAVLNITSNLEHHDFYDRTYELVRVEEPGGTDGEAEPGEGDPPARGTREVPAREPASA